MSSAHCNLLRDARRDDRRNQLATAFARLAPSNSGVELYGEFLREDHNADLRDLIGEPDHASAYTLGARRAWRHADGISAITFEHSNDRFSHLLRVRPQASIYTHSGLSEGHTHEGELLGSSAPMAGQGFSRTYHLTRQSRSREIVFETRALAPSGEAITTGPRRLSGVHSFRVVEALTASRALHLLRADVVFGHGDARDSHVCVELVRVF